MDKLQELQKQRLALMREETVVSQQSQVSLKPLKSTYQDVTIKVLFWLQCAILLTSGIKDIVLYRCTRDDPSACANVFIESRVIIIHAVIHFVCAAIICILYRREIPSKIVISFVFWSLWTSFLLVMHLVQLFNYLEDWTKSLIIAMALTCVYIVVSFVQGAVQYKFLKDELSAAEGDQFLMDEEG